MSRKPTLLHRIEYAAFAGMVWLAVLLGDRGADAFGNFVGRLGYLLGFRRKLVESNLRIAFPDADEAWLRMTMRHAYEFVAREALAMLRAGKLPREAVLERTAIKGADVMADALAEGKGVVVVSGHIGNHEMGVAALGMRGYVGDIVVQRQGNPLFDAALTRTRKRFNAGIIDRGKASRQVVRALRQGRIIVFASDQNAGRSGVFVPFFGKLASTHRGAALFAYRAGAPFVFAATLRRGNVYEVAFERLDVDRTGDLDDVVYRMTAAFTAKLEDVVRTAPDQYLWLHRRWRTRPPEERIEDKQV
jgi:Kdo2-lipid IVA lauroyltransferase/acyltransferase